MDTIDGMRVFVAVVEAGSFSAAAERLEMSKALASKYVSQLETRLQARLLNRTTRRLSLTEIGSAYYARSLTLLSELTELEESVRGHGNAPSGLLRIAAPRVFGEDALVDATQAFLQKYPDVRAELSLEERTVDIVAEGFDLAIRIGELQDSNLVARRVAGYQYVLCATPDYLARVGNPEVPNDLLDHDCIVNSVITPTNQWRFREKGRDVQVSVSPRVRVNSARAVREFVQGDFGIGLCLLPTVEDDIVNGRLVRVLTEFESYSRTVYAVYPQNKYLAAKVRSFIDHLVGYLAPKAES